MENIPIMHDALKLLSRLLKRPLAAAGLAIVLLVVAMAVFADQIAPYDPIRTDFTAILQAPSPEYRMGTDSIGRDVFSRIIYGSRASLQAGLIAVGLAVAIGLPIGLLSGYYRGFVDEYIVMRITDAVMAFPIIVLALALATVMTPSLTTAMIAIGIVYAPIFIRLTRGQVLSVRESEYVEAAHAIGAPNFLIIVRHVFPNILSPVLVQASLSVASAILVEAALSFLGLGVQPPTPSWGSMLRLGVGYLDQAAWVSLWPGFAIFVTVLGINLAGDGLRDVLDPKEQK